MKNKPKRGFDALVGETIVKIDARAINIVRIQCASGRQVEIDAEERHYDIEIVACQVVDKKPKANKQAITEDTP